MQDKQSFPDNSIDKAIQEFNPCAGRECSNVGKNHLKVLFINKFGWFCDYCKDDLINLKLIQEDE